MPVDLSEEVKLTAGRLGIAPVELEGWLMYQITKLKPPKTHVGRIDLKYVLLPILLSCVYDSYRTVKRLESFR